MADNRTTAGYLQGIGGVCMSTARSPLRVVFVVAGLTTSKGGLERIGARVASAMAERGHRVAVFAAGPEQQPPLYPLHSEIRLLRYREDQTAKAIAEARARLVTFEPDVCVPLFSWVAAMQWPMILHGTGIPMLYSERNNPMLIENERMTREQRLAVMAAADRIHLHWPQFLGSLPPIIRERATNIANPVLPATQIAMPDEANNARFRCMAIGRIVDTVKQYSLLFKAFSTLAAKFPQWDIYLFGHGKDEAALYALRAELGLEDRIFMPGITHQPECEYARSHLFCIPSRFEGFPSVLTEALAHGLPSVGFAVCSGVNELIRPGQNGLLAEQMTPESLAACLAPLMEDAQKRKAMGVRAVHSMKKYHPEKVYDQWENLLYETASCKGATQLMRLDDEGQQARLHARELMLCENILQKIPVHSCLSLTKKVLVANEPDATVLQNELRRLDIDIDNIYASLSWRMTSSLRRVVKALRGF